MSSSKERSTLTGNKKEEGQVKQKFNLKEFILKTATFIAIALFVIFMPIAHQINEARKIENKDYPNPNWSDFKISILSCLTIYGVKYLFIKILVKPHIALVDSKKTDPILRESRGYKMVTCLFKSVYFMFSVSLGYYILWDAEFAPRALGFQKGGNIFNY